MTPIDATENSDNLPVDVARRAVRVDVSVAIPVYNEEDTLLALHSRLRATLDSIDGRHEIVFVNDGSTDQTAEMLSALAAADEQVRVVHLSRNFGHQAALSAAFDYVSGDVMVLMDGDLQDAPEAIHRFIEKYLVGYDVVYAIREKRKESWLLRLAYHSFYCLISRMSKLDLPRGAGDFGLLSRRVVQAIRNCPERHRYLRGLRRWVGFRQTGLPVERDARYAGESKYSWWKLFSLAFDGIFSFSVAPLRAAIWLGVFTMIGSLAFVGYATIAHLFFGQSPAGFTALITAITFLAGVQLAFLGVIGEYIGRIFEQVKLRPMYLVDRVETWESLLGSAHSRAVGNLSNWNPDKPAIPAGQCEAGRAGNSSWDENEADDSSKASQLPARFRRSSSRTAQPRCSQQGADV